MNRPTNKNLLFRSLACFCLLAVVLPVSQWSFPASSEDGTVNQCIETTDNDPVLLSPQDFIRHYCQISLLRFSFRDDPAGFMEALENYLANNELTQQDMKKFVTTHQSDPVFWRDLWKDIEEELKKHLETEVKQE
jgi:hypothetical protein